MSDKKHYIFFDTETTGIIDYKKAWSDPRQPYIVQLAYIVTDQKGKQLAEVNTLIKPDGWKIPPEATAVHHITDEMCEKEGRDISEVLDEMASWALRGSLLVAHNIQFDIAMLRREFSIMFAPLDFIDECDHFDTMINSQPIMKLPLTNNQLAAQARHKDTGWAPPGGWPKYKAPSMMQAYEFFFKKKFENAHDALADVTACKDVFFELIKK